MSSNKKKTGVKSIVSPGNFIMVSVDGETYNVTRDDKRFAKIEALVKRKEWDKVFSILGAVRDITMFSEGNIKVEGDQVLFKGKPISNYVADKIVAMISEGKSDFQPLARFLDKLMQSQHKHVQEHLFKFLEYGNIPLTPDGDFLGYKRVQSNFLDSHSGQYDNSPGNVVKMPREKVVEDPHQACSSGLHVGVKQYVDGFTGSRTVIVKVDPRNVVSVPYDYGHQKMRTCEYYVVAEYDPNQPLTSEVYHVTGEEQSKAIKKPAKVEKYVAVSAGPLRGPDGRFLKKKAIAKTKGPVRDSSGRFLKKDKMVTVALPPPVPVPAPVEDDIDEYDEYESDLDGRW